MVAIILIIAAIAIPNLLRARMAANESSAVASIRTINTAEITYNSSYPSVGYAAALAESGRPRPRAYRLQATACLIDSVSGQRDQERIQLHRRLAPVVLQRRSYFATAVPITVNQTGIRSFCSFEDAVIRVQPTGAAIASEAACESLRSAESVDRSCRQTADLKVPCSYSFAAIPRAFIFR